MDLYPLFLDLEGQYHRRKAEGMSNASEFVSGGSLPYSLFQQRRYGLASHSYSFKMRLQPDLTGLFQNVFLSTVQRTDFEWLSGLPKINRC